MKRPLVSVVVTTRNEEKMIGECLASVKGQDYPSGRVEVVVVDNGSTDATVKIASRFTPLVFNHGPERSAQRNLGIEKSRGDYILYLDADMRLSPGVIAEAAERSERENLAGLYIPERIIGEGFWGRVRNFERGFYDGTVIDAVRFVRRATAREIGGFDESLNGPEDWDFDRRIRAAGGVGITRSVLYHQEGKFNLRRYLAKKRYYTRSFAPYIAKWGREDPEIRKQFGFAYRYLGVFLEKGKWRRLLAYPLLAGGMIYLRSAVGLAYLASGFSQQR